MHHTLYQPLPPLIMPFSPQTIKMLKLLAPTAAFTTSSAIGAYSFLLTPTVVSTAAEASPSLALHQIRYFFETGKYIFPQMGVVSAALFGALAYAEPDKLIGYSIAAAGCLSILPFTSLYMIPKTNNVILDWDDKAVQGDKAIEKKRDEIVKVFGDFKRENYVRAGMFWTGAVVGLWTILS